MIIIEKFDLWNLGGRDVPLNPKSQSPKTDTSSTSNDNEEIVDSEEIIIIDPQTEELDLNHGRIGKLENLEPLTRIQRFLNINMIIYICHSVNIFTDCTCDGIILKKLKILARLLH